MPNLKFFQFGTGPYDLADRSVIGINDTGRVGKLTLISDTGLAPFVEGVSPA